MKGKQRKMSVFFRIMIFTVVSAIVFYGLGYFLNMEILFTIGSMCIVITAIVLLVWIFKLLFPGVFPSQKNTEE